MTSKASVKDGPTARVLTILDYVSTHGPITISELDRMLPFSRAAIWRALDVLRGLEWVRMRSGDHAFELTFKQYSHLSTAHHGFRNSSTLSPLFLMLEQEFNVNCCIAGFTHQSQVTVIESSDAADYGHHAMSLLHHPLAVSSLMGLDRVTCVRHLQIYMAHCSRQDKYFIESGEFSKTLRKFQNIGYIDNPDDGELSMPITLNAERGYGIRLRHKKGHPLSYASVVEKIVRFRQVQPNLCLAPVREGDESPIMPNKLN